MVYTANWGIICYLPPFRGTRNNHWNNTCFEIHRLLVGGWTNPFEKLRKSNWIISPGIGVKIITCLKPPPSLYMAYKPIKTITPGRSNDVQNTTSTTSTPLAAQTASKKAKVAEHNCGLSAVVKKPRKKTINYKDTPPKFNISPEKWYGWKASFLLGWYIFRGELLNFRWVC